MGVAVPVGLRVRIDLLVPTGIETESVDFGPDGMDSDAATEADPETELDGGDWTGTDTDDEAGSAGTDTDDDAGSTGTDTDDEAGSTGTDTDDEAGSTGIDTDEEAGSTGTDTDDEGSAGMDVDGGGRPIVMVVPGSTTEMEVDDGGGWSTGTDDEEGSTGVKVDEGKTELDDDIGMTPPGGQIPGKSFKHLHDWLQTVLSTRRAGSLGSHSSPKAGSKTPLSQPRGVEPRVMTKGEPLLPSKKLRTPSVWPVPVAITADSNPLSPAVLKSRKMFDTS